MKLKDCPHPEPRKITADNSWCPACGMLWTLGTWEASSVFRDTRRWFVAEPTDLPPLAERRAWEAFAAANLPFAAATIEKAHAEHLETDPTPWSGEVVADMTNALAANMADRMMGVEWTRRFVGPTDTDGGENAGQR